MVMADSHYVPGGAKATAHMPAEMGTPRPLDNARIAQQSFRSRWMIPARCPSAGRRCGAGLTAVVEPASRSRRLPGCRLVLRFHRRGARVCDQHSRRL